MELQDSGKPLTPRRIIAVKTAIDRVSAGIEQAKVNAHSLYREDDAERNANIDNLISVMVSEASGDKDALEIAVANARKYLVGGDANLRTPEKIKAKMKHLLETLTELRTAAKGNQAMINAGKAFMKVMEGKDIPKGLIRSMIESVNKMHIGAIKSISASASGPALHKAVLQLYNNIQVAMKDSGAGTKLDGADEKVSANDFAAELIMARCSDSATRKIATAFTGDNTKTLKEFYGALELRMVPITDASSGLKEHSSKIATKLKHTLETLYTAAQTSMGVAEDKLKGIAPVENPNYGSIYAGDILDSVVGMAREEALAENAKFCKDAVGGEGPIADALRELYGNFAGPEASNAKGYLDYCRNEIITGMLNRNICIQCQKFASGKDKDTYFYGDITRNLNVNLPGGKKLANDFAAARDQLAELVTNGAKKKYADLTQAEKAKVHIAQSSLSSQS